jgi:hypothetical protein
MMRHLLNVLSRTHAFVRAAAGGCMLAIAASVASGCVDAPITQFEELLEARRLAADLHVQFTKSSDAGNRAVMADTDEASVEFRREAEEAMAAVTRDRDQLASVLAQLGYTPELQMLEEFNRRFAEYHALESSILELAVENTNLKAQRLSFGPAQEAVDAFRRALDAVATNAPSRDAWRSRAEVETAVAAVLEIQVVQAPYIAESDEAAMTRLEKRAAGAEAVARRSLETLASLVRPAARSQLALAKAALDRFLTINAEIFTLARRNSNVKSLALSLGQKRVLTATCEEAIETVQSALAKRTFAGTR